MRRNLNPRTMSLFLIIILVAVVLVVYLYNGLVTLSGKAKEGWVDLETLLKRRYDLIPNLVETLKNVPGVDASILTKVADLRTKAMQTTSLVDKAEAEAVLSETLKDLLAAANNEAEFQKTFKELEDAIQVSRRFYNGAVRDFNTKIAVTPNNLLADKLGFAKLEFFETKDEMAQEVVVTPVPTPMAAEPAPAQEPVPAPEPTPAPAPEPAPAQETPVETPVPEPVATPAPAPAVEPAATPETPVETPAPEPTPEPTPAPEAPTAETPPQEPEQPAQPLPPQ